MPTEETVDLDASVALVLDLGMPEPLATWQRADWVRFERDVQTLKDQAQAGATVRAGREQVARAVARFAGLNDPTRAETVELLIALLESINRVMLGSRSAYLGIGLQLFGWPSDPDERMLEHLIAAADLGIFDPPDQPPRRTEDRSDQTAMSVDPNGVVFELKHTVNGEDETAAKRARRICSTQPAPTRPATAREQFLFDWEELLGSIVNRITEELWGGGYLEDLG
jgi:hypothetical protein